MAARWGMRKLPAVALFRGSVYLGACQGLKDWDEYLRELAEIAARTEAPKRMISILPAGGQADHHCGRPLPLKKPHAAGFRHPNLIRKPNARRRRQRLLF